MVNSKNTALNTKVMSNYKAEIHDSEHGLRNRRSKTITSLDNINITYTY